MIYGQPITFGGGSGEIAITDNGTFDVKKYATANVNIVPKLVWTNAQIGVADATFAAQTLTFNGEYDGFLVETAYSSGYDSMFNQDYWSVRDVTFFPIGADDYHKVIGRRYSKSSGAYASRGVGAVTKSSIVFDAGNDDTRTDNAHVIPTRIWGVKFTL